MNEQTFGQEGASFRSRHNTRGRGGRGGGRGGRGRGGGRGEMTEDRGDEVLRLSYTVNCTPHKRRHVILIFYLSLTARPENMTLNRTARPANTYTY